MAALPVLLQLESNVCRYNSTMEIPEFVTKRLLLRGVGLNDVPSYTRHFVDYEVIRNLAGAVPWPYPENGVRDFVADVILPNQGTDRWV